MMFEYDDDLTINFDGDEYSGYDDDDDDSDDSDDYDGDFDESTLMTTSSFGDIQNLSDCILGDLDSFLLELKSVSSKRSASPHPNTQYDFIQQVVTRQQEEQHQSNLLVKVMDGITNVTRASIGEWMKTEQTTANDEPSFYLYMKSKRNPIQY